MKKMLINPTLESEEKQATKWFVSLFYSIFILYDFLSRYIFPNYIFKNGTDHTGFMGIWFYIIMMLLLPSMYYILKKNNGKLIKYICFGVYILLTIIEDLGSYLMYPRPYASGNVVEVFAVLFTPIFVNTHFFWFVFLAVIGKYVLLGLVLKSVTVILAVISVLFLAIIAYILLKQFERYVRVLKISYDRQLESLVKGVIATLELKDPYTRGHSERVAAYALILAKDTEKFTSDELKEFYYACLLHDIGKIHIPDHILTKPSRLTNEEFEIIKTHPTVGADAVKEVEGLQRGISVIRSHHERWDGKGYPDQLKETEISLLARITAVADAFDAMTSSRSYRAALPLEEAYKRIVEGKGTQFDPDLIDLFKKVYPAWKETHQKLSCKKDMKIFHEKEVKV
ncbi:HD-GYP domain-containing protein [Bacillus sp. CGMCC 1.60114]|uniref:HD-GYP domain-containing protein n=1 Tax=unclassified Bacillus (in: firmicutes) TaxID=185979 RepID=UPI003629A350